MATTDWVLVRFQAGLALLTGVVTVLCTVALAFIFNRRIERLKAEFETHQAIRGERKEIFYEVLGVLGRMRYAIDEFSRSLGSPALQQHAAKMDELRAELYRLAPTAFMVLGSVGSSAFEAYRKIAQPLLSQDASDPERWKKEGTAIENALKELISAGQRDLGY
jgi:hypothetical protein